MIILLLSCSYPLPNRSFKYKYDIVEKYQYTNTLCTTKSEGWWLLLFWLVRLDSSLCYPNSLVLSQSPVLIKPTEIPERRSDWLRRSSRWSSRLLLIFFLNLELFMLQSVIVYAHSGFCYSMQCLSFVGIGIVCNLCKGTHSFFLSPMISSNSNHFNKFLKIWFYCLCTSMWDCWGSVCVFHGCWQHSQPNVQTPPLWSNAEGQLGRRPNRRGR